MVKIPIAVTDFTKALRRKTDWPQASIEIDQYYVGQSFLFYCIIH
jgi:hypothetical protein